MPYTLLRYGDRLPTVAVAQVLLNRTIPEDKLVVDGIYGRLTKAAVRAFQSPRRLGRDGIIGKQTWPRLVADAAFTIIDTVDVTDPDVMNTEGADVRDAGGQPIFTGNICNGVGEVTDHVRWRAINGGGDIILLRFFGHGSSGNMGVSDGVGSFRDPRNPRRRIHLEDDDWTSISSGNVRELAPTLGRLHSIFGLYSSVELHGCNVARGRNGRRLIDALARIFEVPVTGAAVSQYAGDSSTFHFEGRTYTAFPGGLDLKSWARRLPALVEMSPV